MSKKRIQFNDYEKGDTIPEIKIPPIQHMDLVRYAGASGDFNPIHTDPDYAKKVGLDGTIAHGMYIMGLLSRLATNWAPLSQIKSYGVKFKGMTRPGQSLTLRGKIKRKKEEEKILVVAVEAVTDDDGKTTVAGEFTVAAD